MVNKNQTQQGDVWFERIEKIPEGAIEVPRENELLILAKGESSGHHHAIADKGAKIYQLTRNEITETYLEVLAPSVTVDHQEHHRQLKTTGIYRFGQKREHDYFADMERQVQD